MPFLILFWGEQKKNIPFRVQKQQGRIGQGFGLEHVQAQASGSLGRICIARETVDGVFGLPDVGVFEGRRAKKYCNNAPRFIPDVPQA